MKPNDSKSKLIELMAPDSKVAGSKISASGTSSLNREPNADEPKTEEKSYLSPATKIILIFISLFFLWSFLAPINASIIASGEIILDSNKKMIQHLEGGIIEEIKVKEGDLVKEGQDLVILNTTQVRAKIAQTSEGIKGLEFQKTATQKRIRTLQSELEIVSELLKNSNSSLTRKLDLQKQLNESEGKLGELIANIASLQSQYQASVDTLGRSIIKAPVSGIVMDLKYQTIGGVISPATEIMYVVPQNDKLIAEVKVKPQDIDLLQSDMKAKIQLTAYKSKLMPKLEGKVIQFSADSFKEQTTGQVYFKARIEIPESELKKLKHNIKLTPGMPVEAFIITGTRTMFQYLMSPIKDSAYKAFREE